MPRPKSLDKRNAILDAAIDVFAERGLESSPTSEISKRAGVAEGTLFTYFSSKDDLINALYCDIKREVADSMMSGFPRRKSVKERVEHVWNAYADWALANPNRKKVIDMLKTSDKITEQSRQAGAAAFVEIGETACEGIENRIVRDIPGEFIAASLSSLVDTTIEFMKSKPTQADHFKAVGFEMFWNGIVRS